MIFMDGLQITLFGYNDRGFVGFIHGTNELVYLEKPSNWEELAKEAKLRFISEEDVAKINEESLKSKKKETKNARKRTGKLKKR